MADKLTENEFRALRACLNYDNRTEQLSDNFSNAGVTEFREVLGWGKHQVAGLVSSLQQKGMGEMDTDLSNPVDLFWLSEDGVNAIFDRIEKENN